MKARKLLGGLMVTVCSGLLVASQFGAANVGAQDDPEGDEAAASSAIETKELCVWFVNGVADSFSMSPVAGEPAEYDGTAYSLTSDNEDDAIDDVNIYVSGSETLSGTKDNHAPCTFYGNPEGIAYQAAIEAGGFTAAVTSGPTPGPDTAMNFDPTGGSPLLLTVTEASDGACRSGETGDTDDWAFANISKTSDALVTETDLVTLLKADVWTPQSDAPTENSACTASHVLTVTVPADKTPTQPGKDYTLTGPTFTLSFEILG
jgi:hypothetical protein